MSAGWNWLLCLCKGRKLDGLGNGLLCPGLGALKIAKLFRNSLSLPLSQVWLLLPTIITIKTISTISVGSTPGTINQLTIYYFIQYSPSQTFPAFARRRISCIERAEHRRSGWVVWALRAQGFLETFLGSHSLDFGDRFGAQSWI